MDFGPKLYGIEGGADPRLGTLTLIKRLVKLVPAALSDHLIVVIHRGFQWMERYFRKDWARLIQKINVDNKARFRYRVIIVSV